MDGPKHPVESTKCLLELVQAFGPFALGVKTVCGKCLELLDKPDKKVKEQAVKLLGELLRWMGRPSLEHALAKLDAKVRRKKNTYIKVEENLSPAGAFELE